MDSGIYDKALLPDIAAYPAAFQHPTRDTLDVMMAKRKMSVTELSERVEITMANISILKNGKARAIRFDMLEKICQALDCQPGDILAYEKEG